MEHASNPAPRRRLRVRHAMAVCVGMVIGAGIFRTSPEVAANLDGPGSLMLAWLLGGLLSLVGALCFAELAAAFPDQGGDYQFLRRAWGQRVGHLFAWSRFAVIHTGSIALLAFVFGDYLGQVLELGVGGRAAVGAGLIVLLTWVNLRGVRVGAGTQVVLMALVVCGLLLVVAGGAWAELQGAVPVDDSRRPREAVFGLAMVFVLLAYGGWSDAATLSAEIDDPRRGMLRALVGGMSLVLLLYLLANWAYLRVLGFDGLAASSAPAADLMRAVFGVRGEWLMVGVVGITSISVMNALMIAGARTTYASARDLRLLGRLGEWDERRGTPPGALVALAAVSLGLVGLGTVTRGGFATMVDYLSPVYWGFLVLSALAVIRLRHLAPAQPRPFRVPLYPWLPLLFAASCAYLFYSSVVYVRLGALVGLAVMALGAGLLWAGARR